MSARTVLVVGIPSESPVAMVVQALIHRGADCLMVDQRQFAQTPFQFKLEQYGIEGTLVWQNRYVDLADIRGVYLRPMDESRLPSIRQNPDSCLASARQWHKVLFAWTEITAARVVNRLSSMSSNSSKPFQAQLIQSHGFTIPETLISNQPEEVQSFIDQHRGQVIFKSASGARSIVQDWKTEDCDRLEKIRWCPVQFQEKISGVNIRVHVVGERLFATRIESDVVDYRYAHRFGSSAKLSATTLCPDLENQCLLLAQALGLPFAGIDLIQRPSGQIVCLEVNPSPGFSYFENATDQPIAATVADFLCAYPCNIAVPPFNHSFTC